MLRLLITTLWITALLSHVSTACAGSGDESLDAARAEGMKRSEYLRPRQRTAEAVVLEPQLDAFRSSIQPILQKACVECHGPELQEGNIRLDTLNPDLHQGPDVAWWVEVFAVLSKGEMPPQDAEPLSDEDRSRVVEWLSREIQTASIVRKEAEGHTSFRRMTRYEYNYALQDLLDFRSILRRTCPRIPALAPSFRTARSCCTCRFNSSRCIATWDGERCCEQQCEARNLQSCTGVFP